MYTVEHNFDETRITILDDSGDIESEDVEVILEDDCICIRQWDTELDLPSLIIFSPDMWEELLSAVKASEGSYNFVS